MNKQIKLLISLFLPLIAGAIGSAFTFTGIESWYSSINKPSFNPPNWIFGPVWTTLYILMGISLYLVWQKGLKDKFVKNSFVLFLIHLVLNSLWSIVFFGLSNPAGALVVIVILWLMILVLIIRFYKIKKLAAYLLIPYILWVSFASVLNYSIWQLNTSNDISQNDQEIINYPECVIESPDQDGYLLKICKYLKDNQDHIILGTDPAKYNIKKIERGYYTIYDNLEKKEMVEALIVYLDCCYTGDIAYFDKNGQEVIGFDVGDI